MWSKVIDFARARRRLGKDGSSVLGRQIRETLCPGMHLPDPLEQLFRWIEANRLFIDVDGGRLGFLFPEREMKAGWSDDARPGGTDITFAAEGNVNLRYWFKTEDADIQARLCVFAKTGGDGSMAAFWLADDGSQKIVHLGSGSGSTTVCILADDPVDFLRLLAIGYDEICWGDAFSEPPNAGGEFTVGPNKRYADWVTTTFGVTVPELGSEIVRNHAEMDDDDSADAFWNWVRTHTG
jgi:hypothetical protein